MEDTLELTPSVIGFSPFTATWHKRATFSLSICLCFSLLIEWSPSCLYSFCVHHMS